VGAGKSSLLSAVWGESCVGRGSLHVSADVAIVPQRPFTIGANSLPLHAIAITDIVWCVA